MDRLAPVLVTRDADTVACERWPSVCHRGRAVSRLCARVFWLLPNCKDSLPQQILRELDEDAEDREAQPVAGSGGVDFFGRRGEPDVDRFEVGDRFQQVGRLRPRRSNRRTTGVSPGRNASVVAASSGRSIFAPDALSVQTRKQAAAFNVSSCNSGFWSVAETLA